MELNKRQSQRRRYVIEYNDTNINKNDFPSDKDCQKISLSWAVQNHDFMKTKIRKKKSFMMAIGFAIANFTSIERGINLRDKKIKGKGEG